MCERCGMEVHPWWINSRLWCFFWSSLYRLSVFVFDANNKCYNAHASWTHNADSSGLVRAICMFDEHIWHFLINNRQRVAMMLFLILTNGFLNCGGYYLGHRFISSGKLFQLRMSSVTRWKSWAIKMFALKLKEKRFLLFSACVSTSNTFLWQTWVEYLIFYLNEIRVPALIMSVFFFSIFSRDSLLKQ